MSNFQKASIEEIVNAYRETGTVWAAGKRLGLCGQSVWERLKSIGYPMRAMRWTTAEDEELLALAGSCTIGEIARRLGRSYGTVATRISDKGIGRRFGNNQQVKIPRGAGFDKASIQKHVRALDTYTGSLRQYARMNSIGLEPLVNATQRHFPEWWEAYVKAHTDLDAKVCAYCERVFYPMTKKQMTCGRKCASHLRSDKDYFGGKRRLTIGLSEGVCQLCEEAKPVLASHHVYGKQNDPDNNYLIALCNGCHHLVELLANRKFCNDSERLENLILLAICRRGDFKGEEEGELYVEVDIDIAPFEEDIEAAELERVGDDDSGDDAGDQPQIVGSPYVPIIPETVLF